jgi:DNA-binding NarL/FixJ family response regulator
MKSVLIADSDPVMLEIIASLLRDHGIYFRIIKIEDSSKALKIIDRIQIDMVITGLRIPEADCVKLIENLKKNYPDIKTVTLTDVISPALKSRLNEIGVAAYIEEPVNMDQLTELILSELKIGYGGRVRGISMSSFTQMLELEGATCSLQIRKNKAYGRLYFKGGDLIAAEIDDLNSHDAAVKILGWENVQIDIDYLPFEKEKEIKIPLMNLLLATHKAQDEKNSEKTDQRQYPRFSCNTKVDFDINDWSYEGVITNISLGGLFIETRHPVTVGNEIILELTSLDKGRHCSVKGKVVRRDAKGVGIQFNELSMYQQQVVQSHLK